ncbi:MAG TPA: protein kinase, partial [Gemmatimonadaceae bacterium]|nr:protein kinase [Gemmatimonadaceae bacterium]
NDRTVALKILHPELAAGLGVERFQHEITVTANLQHPHILPIHDSGESEGALFLVMPFVEGESLRNRLARERRLPVADVVRLAREVGGALAYAHSRGIVHRDVKPENILLSSGHAVVADFGLALALHAATEGGRRTGPGIVLGTLAYLSPEQATGSADARSDQYCLAAVLYEALAGAPPHEHADPAQLIALRASGSPRSLRGIRSDVPEALDRAILRALSPEPEARFPTVAAFVDALQHAPAAEPAAAIAVAEVPAPPRARPRTRRRALLALALPVVLIAGWWAWTAARTPPVSKRAWVLLAGMENRTGDSLLDRALDAVVEAGLEQSAYVNLVPRARIRSTLAMMRRDSAGRSMGPLDEALAREVAQRNGVTAVIAGSIDRIDSSFVVGLRLLRASDGDQLGALTSVAPTRGAIVDAVDDVVRRMRRRIGESADSLATRDQPLPFATTRSLEALRLYGDGLAASRAGDRLAASELWRRAVAIDSEFVSAHVELGAAYYIANQPPQGEAHFTAALRFLDRATDREQLRARAAIESHRGNRDGAIVLRRTLLARYPDDLAAWRQLAYDLMRSHRSREAESAYREIIARDSSSGRDFVNLASVLGQSGRYEEAVRAYRRSFALEPSALMANNVNTEFGIALVLAGRRAEARAAHDSLLAGNQDQQAHGARSIGLLLMTEGRYREAVAYLRRAVALSDQPKRELTLARNRLFLAAALLDQGLRDGARAEVLAAHEIFRRAYLDPAFLVTLGRALVRVGEPGRARVVLDSLRARMPASPNPVLASDQRLLAGEIALAAGRPDSALRLMEVPRTTEPTIFTLDGPARALVALGRHAEAARRYEAAAASPRGWIGREGVEVGVLARLRAGQSFEAAGDRARATRSYEQFLASWPDADPDLPPVRLARARLQALGAGSGERNALGERELREMRRH